MRRQIQCEYSKKKIKKLIVKNIKIAIKRSHDEIIKFDSLMNNLIISATKKSTIRTDKFKQQIN